MLSISSPAEAFSWHSLRTSHHDTVGDNQAHKYRKSCFDISLGKGSQQLIDHDHQRGDDRHLHDDPPLLGIWWRIIEINMLENAVTSVTASVITTAVSSLRVTARLNTHPAPAALSGYWLKSGPISTFNFFQFTRISHGSALLHVHFSERTKTEFALSRNQNCAAPLEVSVALTARQRHRHRQDAQTLSSPSAQALRCRRALSSRQTARAS